MQSIAVLWQVVEVEAIGPRQVFDELLFEKHPWRFRFRRHDQTYNVLAGEVARSKQLPEAVGIYSFRAARAELDMGA